MAADQDTQAASGERLTIVAMGDSITAGTPGFMSPREAPPEGRGNPESQYAYWLGKKYPDWEILNRGVRGQRTDQILKRFEYDVFRYEPQVVILLAGINDLHQGYPAGHVKEYLQLMYEAARNRGIHVMACSILPYNYATEETHRRIQEVNAWIRDYAGKNNLGFCDTYAALNDPQRPGKLKASADEIHPDVDGYRLMAKVIGEALEPKLKEWGLEG